MQLELDTDGFCCGPLFAPVSKCRPPKPKTRGWGYRDKAYSQRTPCWADPAATEAVYNAARALTATTGEPHEVDHLVPINHPLVCGLHWHANLCPTPALLNRAKSNNRWPGMWGEQGRIDGQ